MIRALIIFISILFYRCQHADINDLEKRNENWAFWVDSLTGEASWIPVGGTTVNNGRYTLFYTKGTIYEKGKIRNGKNTDTIYCYGLKENIIKFKLIKPDTLIQYYVKDGPYIAYFQNCKVLEKGIVKNHTRGNDWTRFFKSGSIEWIEKLEGNTGWTIRYYENGHVSDSSYHINGKGHGRIKHWYENGQIKEITDWNNGIQNGIYETSYENGKPKQKAHWVNGNRDGKIESWYDNGQQEFVHFYKNGSQEGISKEWYSNGNIKRIENYVSGKKERRAIEYHENGKIRGEGIYTSGKQFGIWLWYRPNGTLMQRDTYIDGQLINVEN